MNFHALTVLAQQAGEHGLDKVLTGVPNAAANLLGRCVDRVLDTTIGREAHQRIDVVDEDISQLKKVSSRMGVTLQSVAARISTLESTVAARELERESREPATKSFVMLALSTAAETPDIGKQCLLGELIADRLATTTESSQDFELRRQLEIAHSCGATHLLALARVMLVTAPPFDFARPIPVAQLTAFFNTIDEATAGAVITYQEMSYLVSIGALTHIQPDRMHQSASPYMNFLTHWGSSVYDKAVLELENRVQQIAENRSSVGVEHDRGIAFGEYTLTAPAFAIAARVSARLSDGVVMSAGLPLE